MSLPQPPLANKGDDNTHATSRALSGKSNKGNEQALVALAESVELALSSIKRHENNIYWTQQLTYFGFMVLIVMVATLLIDAWNNKGESVGALSRQMNEQTILLKNMDNLLQTTGK